MDTGAGEIVYDDPITVGYIVKDREGVVCDDSCEFAFDGVCDDGTESEYYYYYAYYGYYMDDDLGGYYGEEYGYAYDDYYMPDDGYRVSACVEGTDCTDCGGVDAIVDYKAIVADPESGVESCVNTCPYARDGVCDDPRGANYCKLGTDCQVDDLSSFSSLFFFFVPRRLFHFCFLFCVRIAAQSAPITSLAPMTMDGGTTMMTTGPSTMETSWVSHNLS